MSINIKKKYKTFFYIKYFHYFCIVQKNNFTKMLKETVICILFGASLISEESPKKEIFARVETKNVVGYSFQLVKTDKEWITKEIETKYSLRVQSSFPKNAKQPIIEVIKYNLANSIIKHYGKWAVVDNYDRGFAFATEIEGKRIYFNLK